MLASFLRTGAPRRSLALMMRLGQGSEILARACRQRGRNNLGAAGALRMEAGGARDVDASARTQSTAQRAKARGRAGIVGDAAAAASTTASTPEIEPVLLTTPVLTSEIPAPPDAEILPALLIVHVAELVLPSIPSEEPLEVTAPVLVIVSGLSVNGLSTTGPVVLPLMVLDIAFSGLLFQPAVRVRRAVKRCSRGDP